MNNKNSNFDHLIKNRSIPDASSNLSERIIQASLHSKKELSIPNIYERLSNFFTMPKAGLAFAFLALLALSIFLPHLQQSSKTSNDYAEQDYFASVMEDDYLFEAFDISSI